MLSWEFTTERRNYTFTKRIPNEATIIDLINHVNDHPDIWEQTVNRVNNISGYEKSWLAADSLIGFKMKKPHRSQLRAWLDDRLRDSRTLLFGSDVKNAFETLESACEALIVYDGITPPNHGERSDRIMSMTPDEVKYRSTNKPITLPADVENNPKEYLAIVEEAAPLLLAARIFTYVMDGNNGHDKTDKKRASEDAL